MTDRHRLPKPITAPPRRLRAWRSAPGAVTACAFVASLLAMSPPAMALYKVVGTDGKVTYTDKPDTSTQQGKVVSMNPDTGSVNSAPLPLELRQVASRYPVTLYVGNSCQPCDLGRNYLTQRGIPFTEKQVLTNDDSDALEQLTGGREAPTLTVGAQVVRGFGSDLWASYLDAAGYPKESRLPANYQRPLPAPVVAKQAPADTGQPVQRLEPSSNGIPVDNTPSQPGGIKF